LARLRRARLIADIDDADSGTIDAHPLIREHFGEDMRHRHSDAWIEGHGRLFEHFVSTAPPSPDSLEAMQGLFLAVRHGCLAHRYRSAFRDVYISRIMRGDRAYAARQLGSFGALLSILAGFFARGTWPPLADHLTDSDALSSDDQIVLLTHVGSYLTATRGYSSPDVRECYAQLRHRATGRHNTALLYSSLISEWRYSLVTQPLPGTYGVAVELHTFARKHASDEILLGAYRALADTLFFLGRFLVGSRYAKKGVALWSTKHFPATIQEVTSPIVTCISVDAMPAWHLGHTEYAPVRAAEALDTGRHLGDLHAVAVALCFDSFVAVFADNVGRAYESGNALVALSTSESFSFWLGAGRVVQGWAMARLDPQGEGLQVLLGGIRYWEAGGTALARPFWLALAADILMRAKQYEESIAYLTRAEDLASDTRERWWLPEIRRLRGCLVLRTTSNSGEAHQWYRRSLDLAVAQRSHSLALRTAVSAAQLCLDNGQLRNARDLIASARARLPAPRGGTDGTAADALLAACVNGAADS